MARRAYHQQMLRTVTELGVNLTEASSIHDLIGAAYGVDGLILHESDLAPEFLNLKTGLLGELFQKLINYRLPTAVIIPDFDAHGERFSELAREHTKHPQVRFFSSESEGRAWLEKIAGS